MGLKKWSLSIIIIAIIMVAVIYLLTDNHQADKILRKDQELRKYFDTTDWSSSEMTRVKILDFFEVYIEHTIKSIAGKGNIKKRVLKSNDMKLIYQGLVERIKKIKIIAFTKFRLSKDEIVKIMSYIMGQTGDFLKYFSEKSPENITLKQVYVTWIELVEPTLQYSDAELERRRSLQIRNNEELRTANMKKNEEIDENYYSEEVSVPEKYPIQENEYKNFIKKKIFIPIDLDNANEFFDQEINLKLKNGKSFDGKLLKIEGNVFYFDVVFDNGNISIKFQKSEISELSQFREIVVEDK